MLWGKKKRYTFSLFLPEELAFLKVSVLFYSTLRSSSNPSIGLPVAGNHSIVNHCIAFVILNIVTGNQSLQEFSPRASMYGFDPNKIQKNTNNSSFKNSFQHMFQIISNLKFFNQIIKKYQAIYYVQDLPQVPLAGK